MAPSVSGGGSGSGAPTIRSSVTSTTRTPWSCRPAMESCYRPGCRGRAKATLDHPDEPLFRQVIARDRGLDVGRANQGGPCPRAHIEAQRTNPRNEVVHERGHALLL